MSSDQTPNDFTLASAPDEPSPDPTMDGASSLGPLLDETDKDAVHAAVLNNWKSQDKNLSLAICEVEQAEFWRRGEYHVYIRPGDDDYQHEIYRPPGAERLPKMPDKVDQNVRRLTAQLLVDEPVLDAEPETGEDNDQDAAELVSRIFEVEGAAQGWNLRSLMEGALDIASTQKSAFAHIWLDPNGGGEQPVTVMAAPSATVYDEAQPDACLMEPAPMPPQGAPMLDPSAPPPMVPCQNPVTKYLGPNNTLTDKLEADTVKRWVPWPQISLLGMRNVRFLPEWCRGLLDASGVMVAEYVPIGQLKRRYPETVGQMDDAALQKLRNWQPFPDTSILPNHARNPKLIGTKTTDGTVPDDAVALIVWEYHRQSPVYPKGAQIAIGGGQQVIDQSTLEVEIEQPDGRKLPRVLDIPVSQCRCINDWVGMNPYGVALVTKLGPWAELMGQQWTAIMDWLDRWNHPHQFLPIGSIVQPGQLAMRSGEPIYTNPQGMPVTEQVPMIPPDVKEFLDRAVGGIDKESLLSDTAQGLETASVNSGRQAAITINQALVALSSIQQNATDFFVRVGTLLLERLQAYVTVPVAVRYVGDDGAFRADEWRGCDLIGTKQMRLARGSFTMLHPDAKKASILQDVQAGVLPMDEAIDALADGSRSQFAIEDDPVRLRIKRQLAATLHRGAPISPLPIDEIPAVATKRFKELGRCQMSTKYGRAEPQIRAIIDAEYARMKAAAGVMTVAEQQAMQQQQAQAQQAAQQQGVQAKAQMDAAKEQTRAQADIARDKSKAQVDVAKESALAQLEVQKEAVMMGAPAL